MQGGASIRVTYWAEQIGDNRLDDLQGIDEFRRELEVDYPCAIHARPGDLGGLFEFVVEFVSSVSLADVAQFLAAGAAYDVIKEGARGLVLRPFVSAYRRLKKRNAHTNLDIAVLRLVLRDSVVVIYRLSEGSVLRYLEEILNAVARDYGHFALRTGEMPFQVHVPVFEDEAADRLSRFRVLLNVDETIEPRPSVDYLKFWGLEYDFARSARVFDVGRHFLLDEEFLTQARYDVKWAEWYRGNQPA